MKTEKLNSMDLSKSPTGIVFSNLYRIEYITLNYNPPRHGFKRTATYCFKIGEVVSLSRFYLHSRLDRVRINNITSYYQPVMNDVPHDSVNFEFF